MDVRVAIWKVTLAVTVSTYCEIMSDSEGMQEVRCGSGGNESADEYTFFYRKMNDNNELLTVVVNKNHICR
jgi:hypothetical protein